MHYRVSGKIPLLIFNVIRTKISIKRGTFFRTPYVYPKAKPQVSEIEKL